MNRTTGYVFEELCMWYDQGNLSAGRYLEPCQQAELVDTKRRIHNLLAVTGMIDNLKRVKGRYAKKDEILRFHTSRYVESVKAMSNDNGGTLGIGDESITFAKGAYEIALQSAGGMLAAVEALLIEQSITNAYCLIRPPGHHAQADCGMGFCVFNNVVLGCLHARAITADKPPSSQIKRVAVVDYDVHHGNGTQEAFWNDDEALLISLHQDSNYPLGNRLCC